jgi:hypothetical protein
MPSHGQGIEVPDFFLLREAALAAERAAEYWMVGKLYLGMNNG